MGGASFPTCFGAMLLYYFALMDRHDYDDITNEGGQQRPLSSFKSFLAFINRRENQSLAIFGIWLTNFETTIAIGHLRTDPNGSPFFGWITLSAFLWFNPPLLYFFSQMHKVLSQMSAPDITSSTSLPTFSPLVSPHSHP